MRGDVGHRWWRFRALREIAREHFWRREIAAGDPYVSEGIFERHTVNETKTVFPR